MRDTHDEEERAAQRHAGGKQRGMHRRRCGGQGWAHDCDVEVGAHGQRGENGDEDDALQDRLTRQAVITNGTLDSMRTCMRMNACLRHGQADL